jgi:hypothetical protein
MAVATEFRRSETLLVLLAVLIASALHAYGFNMDLPYRGENEELYYLEPALYMHLTGTWNPKTFGNPGSTVIYPLRFAYDLLGDRLFAGTQYGKGYGLNCYDQVRLTPIQFHVPLKLIALFYSLASVALLYLVAKIASGRRIATVATFIYTVIPIVVEYGKQGRTDTALVFFSLAAIFFCLKLTDEGGWRNYVLAGASLGLAVASRYFGLSVLPILILAVAWRLHKAANLKQRWRSLGCGVASLLVAGLSFFVSSPFVFFDQKTALHDLQFEALSTCVGVDGLSWYENLAYYLTDSIPKNFFAPAMVVAALGLVLVLCRRRAKEYLLVCYLVIVLLGTSLNHRHWERWIIPICPVLSILIAIGSAKIANKLGHLHSLGKAHAFYPHKFMVLDKLQRWFRRAGKQTLEATVLVVVMLLPINELIIREIACATYSTWTEARLWIDSHVPKGVPVAEDMDIVRLVRTERPCISNFWRTDFIEREVRFRRPVDLKHEGFLYLIVNELFGFYMMDPKRYPAEVKFYRELEYNYEPLKTFVPRKICVGFLQGKQRGLEVWLYRVDQPRHPVDEGE